MTELLIDRIFVCILYAICSMSFSFAAKFLFKIFAFHNTTLLLLYECTINIIVCTGFILYRNQKKAQQKKGETLNLFENLKLILWDRLKSIKHTIPYSMTYGTGAFCGMKALSLINIPLFLALRRTLIFFVFIFQFVLGHQNDFSYVFISSIALITVGALIAGFQHFNDDIFGYALVIANNILSAIGLHLAKRLNQNNNFGPLELVYNNSLNLWPMLLILSLISGDLQNAIQLEFLYRSEFVISITIVAMIGFLLNLATNNCTMKNSPFAIALTHNIKDIFSTMISFLLFTDVIVDQFMMWGIFLSFCGSFIYSYHKLKEFKTVKINKSEKETEQIELVENIQLIDVQIK